MAYIAKDYKREFVFADKLGLELESKIQGNRAGIGFENPWIRRTEGNKLGGGGGCWWASELGQSRTLRIQRS